MITEEPGRPQKGSDHGQQFVVEEDQLLDIGLGLAPLVFRENSWPRNEPEPTTCPFRSKIKG